MLMESLLQVYEDNQPLVKVLSDLSDWDPQIDSLANFALCYFSLPPSFKYFVKEQMRHFDLTKKTTEKRVITISKINFKNILITCKFCCKQFLRIQKAYHNYLKDK